jgi:membrane-associated phospholipid phosphatase
MSRLRTLAIISVCGALITSETIANPFSNVGKLGDMLMVMTPAYALGLTASEDNFDGALQLITSVAAAQLAAEGIKALELEERPNGSDRKSFPSGHATAAFSGAMFVHKRYGWKRAIIPYIMAGVTGWARVEADAHYWQDVLGGAAVAALFTWAFVDKYDTGSYVAISADTNGAKVNFSKKF